MSYQQPDFFRFGTDSIWLTEFIKKENFEPTPLRILELGAGSGVISCELASLLPSAHFTCVELQPEFLPHLNANLALCLEGRFEVILNSVGKFNPQGEMKFDLIVFNPPYFESSETRSSPSQQREICRKHVVDSWDEWMACVERSLALEGEVFWVHRAEREIPVGLKAVMVAQKGELGIWRAGLNVE